MTDGDLVRAGRTLTAMTQMKAGAETRRWDWGLTPATNRFGYSLLVAILVNIALDLEALSLAVGVALFLVLTAIVSVRRR